MGKAADIDAAAADPAAARARDIAAAQLRRTLLLHAAEVTEVGDRVERAELALAAGRPDIARLLYDLVSVAFGFGLADAPARSGPVAALDSAADARGVPAGIAELSALIAAHPGSDLTAAVLEPAEPQGAEALIAQIGIDVAGAVGRLSALLHAPGNEATLSELAALLDTLAPLSRAAPIDPRDHVDADLTTLASIFALWGLQQFLRTNRAIAFAPLGSAALLHAAARLPSRALGAYFSNLSHLLRTSSDLLGIIGAAVPHLSDDDRARWIALLSVNLRADYLLELVDDLADLGMERALSLLLAANAHRTNIPAGPVFLAHVRDGALDNGDFALAERAQAALARLLVNDVAAWRILGDVRATMGDRVGAETALVHALGYAPHNPLIATRLEALREDRFQPFAIVGGIDSVRALALRRIARWNPGYVAPRPPVPAEA